MGVLSIVRNSIGCSTSGERLVMAAREGDLEETKALLEYNPRLARYSTFGLRIAPLHHSASHGHHEVASVLVESGANINLQNSSGQTPLMLACLHGHWEVVQILMLFKANIHRSDLSKWRYCSSLCCSTWSYSLYPPSSCRLYSQHA